MNRRQRLTKEYTHLFTLIRGGSQSHIERQAKLIKLILKDLVLLPQLPTSLAELTRNDIETLINFWQKQQRSISTILNKLAALRFLSAHIPFKEPIPSNIELGLRKEVDLELPEAFNLFDSYQQFRFPIPKVIFGMSLFFGLTFDEAIKLQPLFHFETKGITITRDIAFNAKERFIPYCHHEQIEIIDLMNKLSISPKDSLIKRWSRPILLGLYKGELAMQELPYKQYRYYYACFRKEQLRSQVERHQVYKKIKREMGLTSDTQLWRYLNLNISPLSPRLYQEHNHYEQGQQRQS